jgi:hypothetical protein
MLFPLNAKDTFSDPIRGIKDKKAKDDLQPKIGDKRHR